VETSMRPVVGCWFFLFFCLACAPDVSSDVQASTATSAARAARRAGVKESFVPLSLSIRSDLLRRRVESFFQELPAPVASARACAKSEQARAEERSVIGSGTPGGGGGEQHVTHSGVVSWWLDVQMPLTQMSGMPARNGHHGMPAFGIAAAGISPQSQTVPVTSPRSTVCTLPPLCESVWSGGGVVGVVGGW